MQKDNYIDPTLLCGKSSISLHAQGNLKLILSERVKAQSCVSLMSLIPVQYVLTSFRLTACFLHPACLLVLQHLKVPSHLHHRPIYSYFWVTICGLSPYWVTAHVAIYFLLEQYNKTSFETIGSTSLFRDLYWCNPQLQWFLWPKHVTYADYSGNKHW